MEALKKKRGGLRRTFTNAQTRFNDEYGKAQSDSSVFTATLEILAEKMEEMKILDEIIHDHMIADAVGDDIIATELESADEYKMKYRVAKAQYAEKTKTAATPLVAASVPAATIVAPDPSADKLLKYPKLEFEKFNGDPLQWVHFGEVLRERKRIRKFLMMKKCVFCAKAWKKVPGRTMLSTATHPAEHIIKMHSRA